MDTPIHHPVFIPLKGIGKPCRVIYLIPLPLGQAFTSNMLFSKSVRLNDWPAGKGKSQSFSFPARFIHTVYEYF
jgi:hypothetical protein